MLLEDYGLIGDMQAAALVGRETWRVEEAVGAG
jgi:hypothetical protein